MESSKDNPNPKNTYIYNPQMFAYSEILRHADKAHKQTGQTQYIRYPSGKISVLQVGDDVDKRYMPEQKVDG